MPHMSLFIGAVRVCVKGGQFSKQIWLSQHVNVIQSSLSLEINKVQNKKINILNTSKMKMIKELRRYSRTKEISIWQRISINRGTFFAKEISLIISYIK